MRLVLLPILVLVLGIGGCVQPSKQLQETNIPKQKELVVEDPLLGSPKLKPIFKRQGARKEMLLSAKEKGFIGESDLGYLLFRTEKGLSVAELKKIKLIVQQENNDRRKMYQHLTREQKWKSDQHKKMKKNMFESYLEWDPPGVFYFKNKKWFKK